MGIEQSLGSHIAEAVRRAGGQSAFARIVGRNQSTVFDWLRLGKRLPAEHVLTVERATGVSRHDLPPDLYPAEPAPAATPAGVAPGAPIVACDRGAISQRGVR